MVNNEGKEDPFFSIIMPAYNAELFLEEALDSLDKQSFRDWELIAVDDGSTDRTPQILESYAQSDNRFTVIHQKNSGSAGAARNTAMQYIKGKYCQMLDSDDFITDDFLQKQYDTIQETKSDIVIPRLIFFKEEINNIIREWDGLKGERNIILNGEDGFFYSLNWVIHGCFTIDSEILKRSGYEKELINGDEFTTRKVLFNAQKISFSDPIYYYRFHELSTTMNNKNRIKMFQYLFTDLNIFKYSMDKKMSLRNKRESLKKVLYSLIFKQISYNKEHKKWLPFERELVEKILIETFKKVNIKYLLLTDIKLILLFSLTFHSYILFKIYVVLLSSVRKELNVR